MAIRLHPTFNEQNPVHVDAIERALSVPPGTFNDTLAYRKEARKFVDGGPDEYDHWASVQGTPVGKMDHFLTFGWNRVHPAAWEEINRITGNNEDIVGALSDPADVRAVLQAQGVEESAINALLAVPITLTWC